MRKFLVLQLQGVFQAWGTHTYEDFRPSIIFPTRSGIVGLLGACLGIERGDIESRNMLNQSVLLTVVSVAPEITRKVEDFHTILNARKVDGTPRREAIISRREYLCDAKFYLLISVKPAAHYALDILEDAVKYPEFTPFLGRKSCPLTAPLFYGYISGESLLSVVNSITKDDCIIYSEEELADSTKYVIRDVPVKTKVRQFDKRDVYILAQEASDVHQ